MKLSKKLIALALCAALTLGLAPAANAAGSVRVKLPTFTVTLGGQTIDPAKEEYPFLVYKDITYLPLTYFGCRLLGLYAKWTPETGLVVTDAGAKGAYQSSPRVSRNSGALYASVATGPITIHNKVIENDREEYPFLLFRDITYLPMTWANMHDLLGCDYSFDAQNGLVIDRAESANVSSLYLPIYRSGDGYATGSIAAWRGWFWYQDSEGWISRTPMAGGAREKLFELPINTGYSDAPVWASLKVENDKLYLSYHLGGATMGHDETRRFNEDGTYVTLLQSNGPVGEFDDCRLWADCFVPPDPDNLRISYDQGETWERFGAADYLYGWAYHINADGGSSGTRTTGGTIVRAGNSAYLLGTYVAGWRTPDAEKHERYSAVCRVDLTTGETTEITGPARAFRIAGETVWYVTFDDELRHCALDGSDDAAADFIDMESPKVVSFIADENYVYAVLDTPLAVQGGAGVEPHTEPMVSLAVLHSDGSEGTMIFMGLASTIESVSLEDGWLTLLLKNGSGEMGLVVFHDMPDYHNPYQHHPDIVYQNWGPDYIAAGVSGGKLYYVLK